VGVVATGNSPYEAGFVRGVRKRDSDQEAGLRCRRRGRADRQWSYGSRVVACAGRGSAADGEERDQCGQKQARPD